MQPIGEELRAWGLELRVAAVGEEVMDRKLALAEMVGLFAGLNEASAAGPGEAQAVLNDRQRGEGGCMRREA